MGLMSKLHVLLVVNGGDSELTLGDIPVVKDLIGEKAFLLEVWDSIRHHVVESVVASLKRLLVGETRLLKKVDNHVSSRQFTRGVEVDTDELTKTGRVVIPAPDSPVIRMDWLQPVFIIPWYAPSAMAKIWGGTSFLLLPTDISMVRRV